MKLLVVHAHALLVTTLSALMQRCGSPMRVVHAGSLEEAMGMALRERECTGVLLDAGARAEQGQRVIRELARQGIPAIALARSTAALSGALESGAAGCLSCEVDESMLLSALLVMLGQREREQPADRPARRPAPETLAGPSLLTERQKAVLRQLCAGDANKDIGRELHISEKTVKTHLSAIFKALGVSNRTQAVVAAREVHLDLGSTPAA